MAAFNESAYLAANPDVAKAVSSGQFKTGLDHYNMYGKNENRTFSGVPVPSISKTGIMPATVEPFNSVQKTALEGMAKGIGPVSSRPTEMYDAASTGYKNAMGRSYDPTMAAKYMNPYIDSVVESSLGDIRREHGTLDRDIRERTARIGSYGSTAQGTRQSMNDEALFRETGRVGSALRYQGYNDAINQSQGQFNTETAQQMAALAALTGLGDKYLNYDQYKRGADAGDLALRYGAGETIQNQNQKVLDTIEAERDRENAFPYSQLDFYTSLLGKYPTGTTTTASGSAPPLWQSILGGGLLGSSIGDSIGKK